MWLPDSVRRDAQDASAKYEAELRASTEIRESMDYWNRRLKEIDPYLELAKASHDAHRTGLRPGYWHVMRHNPGAPTSFIVHEGPHGEFREPDSGLLETLAAGDMWSERTMREQQRLAQKARDAKDRERRRERAEIEEEMVERLAQKERVSIVVPR
jgi:hypothetical protein